jgi:hypothetical protein
MINGGGLTTPLKLRLHGAPRIGRHDRVRVTSSQIGRLLRLVFVGKNDFKDVVNGIHNLVNVSEDRIVEGQVR